VYSGLGGCRRHTLQDTLTLQARVLTLEGGSNTLGINDTFGEARPSLGRRRGPRISAPKDDVITTPGQSLPGTSPGIRPEQVARPVAPGASAEPSPTRSKALPCGAGAGSRMSCRPAPSRRSQTAARGARNRPAVTSDPPLLPRPTGERGGQPCRRHATAPSGRAPPTPDTPAWRPRPTRCATGAPDAARKQLHRHLRHRRASSIAEPIPRLEATQRATQQR
jgi:hypothetical protein